MKDAWVAQLVKCPTSAQIIIHGSWVPARVGPYADSSEPGACFAFRISLTAPTLLGLCLSQK